MEICYWRWNMLLALEYVPWFLGAGNQRFASSHAPPNTRLPPPQPEAGGRWCQNSWGRPSISALMALSSAAFFAFKSRGERERERVRLSADKATRTQYISGSHLAGRRGREPIPELLDVWFLWLPKNPLRKYFSLPKRGDLQYVTLRPIWFIATILSHRSLQEWKRGAQIFSWRWRWHDEWANEQMACHSKIFEVTKLVGKLEKGEGKWVWIFCKGFFLALLPSTLFMIQECWEKTHRPLNVVVYLFSLLSITFEVVEGLEVFEGSSLLLNGTVTKHDMIRSE